jgi:hypothetical protein
MAFFTQLFKSSVYSAIDTSGICSIYIKNGGLTTDEWLKNELFHLAIQTSVVLFKIAILCFLLQRKNMGHTLLRTTLLINASTIVIASIDRQCIKNLNEAITDQSVFTPGHY